MEDRIVKSMQMAAPVGRVWRALTDYRQFNEWFEVTMEGPFVAGEVVWGQVTYPKYKHMRMKIMVQAIEPENYFAYKWHPFAVDAAVDYGGETPTLVEFRLEAKGDGTLLTVTESGFAQLPAERYAAAFRANDGGWTQQMNNIEAYISKGAYASQGT